MPKFIEVRRSDLEGGCYVIPLDRFSDIYDTEIEDADPGLIITLTIIEMTEEEHEALPEFCGW